MVIKNLIGIISSERNVNTLRPRQNGRHFPDDIFKWTFLNENISISIKISLNFVPKGSINNIPALVQIIAWTRRQVIIWTNDALVYWRIYASLVLNELKHHAWVCIQICACRWLGTNRCDWICRGSYNWIRIWASYTYIKAFGMLVMRGYPGL